MTGYRNKGHEAGTKALINGIVKLKSDARFDILTEDRDYDALYASENERVSFLSNPFRLYSTLGKLSFLPNPWYYRLINRLRVSSDITRKCVEAFQRSDAVLSSDDIFSSTYGRLREELAQLKAAACFRKPTVLVSHSVGPFKTRGEQQAFAKAMTHVQLITARESISLEYLENMRLKNTRVELTADPAFCLEPDIEEIEKLYSTYNIPREKALIGIAPSQAITHFAQTSYENHFNALRQLILFLTQNLDCHVMLIPHVQERNAEDDDRIICDLLYRKTGSPEEVTVVGLTHSAEEIVAIVSRLDVMIAERMHAAIAGLSQNVPTFVIGYSIKAEGILGDILGFDSLKDYLLPVKKLDNARLKERIKNLYDRRKETATFLSKKMPSFKEKARRNFTLIMSLLEQQQKQESP
jgi:colanic acid/amylovoran biosynthesis protein